MYLWASIETIISLRDSDDKLLTEIYTNLYVFLKWYMLQFNFVKQRELYQFICQHHNLLQSIFPFSWNYHYFSHQNTSSGMLFLRYFLFKSFASYTIYCSEVVILQRCARETFLSRLINNVYTVPGEFSTVCRILRSTLSDGRRVHAAGSLMEDVIGKYLARLRSIRRRVCSRYATNRVIARILLPSAL